MNKYLFCLLGLFLSLPLLAAEQAELWTALAQDGHVALMRHARAPGTGDPARFQLDDCTTQRNLDDTGREQARRTGAAFRARDIKVARVLSSQWCRCRETAELLDLAPVEDLPALNSFFADSTQRTPQTAQLRRYLAELERSGPSVVLVTHQVNITALIGYYPASGEIDVLRLDTAGDFTLLGAISPF